MVADLHDEPFIVRPSRDKFKDASNALASAGIKIRVVYRTAQIDRTLALIAAGIGLSFIPARLVTPAVKQVQVIDMDFNRIGQSQPMAPLWNPARYMRNVVETVRVHAG